MYRQSVVVLAPPEFADVVAELSMRARQVRAHRVDPREDNLLRIFSEQRAAALDLRLLGHEPSEPGKIDAVARRIAGVRLAGGGSGGTGMQIVYADVGTSRDGQWRLFDALRDQLGVDGLPPDQVRHLHQVHGERERNALIEQCRAGRVGVLVSNSRRMPPDLPGSALALHHLDCPMSVNDLRRREGRAADGAYVLRYVTAGSYETSAWQALDSAAVRQRMPGEESRSRPAAAVVSAPGKAAAPVNVARMSFTAPASAGPDAAAAAASQAPLSPVRQPASNPRSR